MLSKEMRVLIIIILLALMLRVIFLAEKPLSLDEPATIRYIDQSFDGMLNTIAQEYRTPLYYLITWSMFHFAGVEILKLFSVLLGVASVVGIYLLGKILYSKKVGFVAALLLALHPIHIAYSQYVREYSLLFFFFIFSMVMFARIIKGGKRIDWILLAIANASLFLTHFFGILLIISQFIALLICQRNLARNFFLQGIIVVIIALPWLFFLFSTVELLGIGDFVKPFDNDLTRFFYALYKFSIGANISGLLKWFPALLGAIIPFFAFIYFLVFRNVLRERNGRMLLIIFLLPLVLLFSISVATQESLFIYRYVSPILLIYVLMVATTLTNIRNRKHRALLFIILFVLIGAADLYYYSIITLPDWPVRFGI